MIDQLCDVRHTIWYEWRSDDFGLMDKTGTERPAYQAAATMLAEMKGFDFDQRLPCSFELDYVLRFVNAQGEAKLVAWTAPPAGGSPDEVRPHPLTLPLSAALSGTAQISGGAGLDLASGKLVLELSGKPLFISVPGQASFGPGVAVIQPIVALDANANLPAEAIDLGVFAQNATWKCAATGGTGTFTVNSGEHGGKPMGVLEYDFRSAKDGMPYVQATTQVAIARAKELRIHARSDVIQQVTFRLIDSTGQTLQSKGRLKGTGKFEAFSILLTGKLEHWDGANDGKVHFPITSLQFSVPRPSEEHPTGLVEYADVIILE
jgi:hypothetical protein